MGKNKLAKFANMERYPHVIQAADVATTNEVFALKGLWHEKFFGNNHPIVLELGCGRGEYTVGMARLFPDKNFIGVDIKGARMWTGATEALHAGMSNVCKRLVSLAIRARLCISIRAVICLNDSRSRLTNRSVCRLNRCDNSSKSSFLFDK